MQHITLEELKQKRQEIEQERAVMVAELEGAYRGALQAVDALIAVAESKPPAGEDGTAKEVRRQLQDLVEAL